MANKSINSLVNASGLDNDDLLVLWDSGTNTAQNMTGAQFSAWLVSLANGHGGISNFSIVDSGTSGDGQLHTATLTYAGDNSTYTFSWRDGYKGDTGPQTYVFFKYADHEPTSDADMGDTPDSWIGIYVGTAIDDPSDLHYTDLVWYEWKGPKGDGVSYTALSSTVGLTKTYQMYTADGTAVGTFTVTDGAGAVSTVNGIGADGDGDVPATVGSVTDLGLTAGSATIAGAYSALQAKQMLVCPASDFTTTELPLLSGNRLTDGTIEIVKGDGTDGWIEFHGRLVSVGTYRMYFDSSDVPTGKWLGACDLLWENSSPTSSFAAQTITLDLSGYETIMVISYQETSALYQASMTVKNAVGEKGRCFNMANYRQFRAFEITSSGVDFGEGYSGAPAATATVNNASSIPAFIYGLSR